MRPLPVTAASTLALAPASSVHDTPSAARRIGVSWTLDPQHRGLA